MSMQKNIIRLALVTVAVLLVPFIAMRFTSEVNWTLSDFIFAGVLIFGTGLLFELARMKAGNSNTYKYAAGLALLATFLLIWVNGAVGIIGDSDVNIFYAAVVFTLFIGTIVARLKPRGMSYTLFTAALIQFLIPIIAYIINEPDFSPGVIQVFMLNSFWVMTFVASGLLFQTAANTHSESLSS